jgi:hypothetical protein
MTQASWHKLAEVDGAGRFKDDVFKLSFTNVGVGIDLVAPKYLRLKLPRHCRNGNASQNVGCAKSGLSS